MSTQLFILGLLTIIFLVTIYLTNKKMISNINSPHISKKTKKIIDMARNNTKGYFIFKIWLVQGLSFSTVLTLLLSGSEILRNSTSFSNVRIFEFFLFFLVITSIVTIVRANNIYKKVDKN